MHGSSAWGPDNKEIPNPTGDAKQALDEANTILLVCYRANPLADHLQAAMLSQNYTWFTARQLKLPRCE